VRLLVEAYPKAASIRTRNGEIPLHFAADSEDFDAVRGPSFASLCAAPLLTLSLPSPTTVLMYRQVEVVRILLEAYPDGARVKDSHGNTPLMAMAGRQNKSDNVGKILNHLIKADPEGLLNREKSGGSTILEAILTNWAEVARVEGVRQLLCTCPHLAQIPIKEARGALPIHLFACIGGFHYEYCGQVMETLIEAYPLGTETQDDAGNLPLHYVVQHHQGAVAAAMVKELLNGDPEGGIDCVSTPNEFNRVALHYVCEWADPAGTVKTLLLNFPDGAMHKDDDAQVPLHCACKGLGALANRNVIELLRVFPDGAKSVDRNGRTPLHICATNPGEYADDVLNTVLSAYPEAAEIQDRDGLLPVHIAAANEGPKAASMLNELMRPGKYPNGARMEDRQGMLPLHHAAHNEGVGAGEMFGELLRCYSEGCKHEDRAGMIPIHHAVLNESESCYAILTESLMEHPEGAAKADRQGLLPLHAVVANMSPAGYDMVKLLVDHYPEALREEDRHGKIPLHHASMSEDPYQIVDFMLRKYSEGASHADTDGLLPLHVGAHNPHETASDLVDLLLCVHNDGAKAEDKDGLLPVQYAAMNAGPNRVSFMDALLTAHPTETVAKDLAPADHSQPISFSNLERQKKTLSSAHRSVMLGQLE